MKKIGKVFGLLILMLMLGVAGAGIYDWGKDRWVAPVSQKMEGEVRPRRLHNPEVEEQRRLHKEEMSRTPPRPPPGSVAEVRGIVRDLGRLLQEHNRQIAKLDDRIMCLQFWITNNPGKEWKAGQQPEHPLC